MRKISANVIVDKDPIFVVSIEGGANIRIPIKLHMPDGSNCDSDIPDLVDRVLAKHNLEIMTEDERSFVLNGSNYVD